MNSRDLDPPPPAPAYPDLILRGPPNWTAVGFLVLLAALHLSVAGHAFLAGHWEGYVSLLFGTVVTAAAVGAYCVRCEVAVLYRHKALRLRTGAGRRLSCERYVPFGAVRAVRVTLGPHGVARHTLVELICHREDVPCPPTAVPRQLGLLLALMIGVPLVKVSGDCTPRQGPDARPEMPATQRADESAAE